jgi:hypothetical protein
LHDQNFGTGCPEALLDPGEKWYLLKKDDLSVNDACEVLETFKLEMRSWFVQLKMHGRSDVETYKLRRGF